MENCVTPLIKAIEEYCSNSNLRCHTPGHRGGHNLSKQLSLLDPFTWDVTELPGLGNLFNEHGPIYESELVTANIYGVLRTLFFTQGSTSAIQTVMLAMSKHFDHILVPRNAHLSVLNSIILSGLIPTWYHADIDQYNLFEPIDVLHVKKLIKDYPNIKLLFLQNPTYEGRSCDIKAVAKLCKDNNITLIVDEAHGGHWIVSDIFPLSAVEVGCDFVIQSAHKTLPALTGASYLHINNRHLIKDCLEARRIIHSTSPSYLILASLDSVNEYLLEEAREKYFELQNLVNDIIIKTSAIANIEVINRFNIYDFTKLSLFFNTKIDKVKRILKNYGVMVEKWNGNLALILMTPSISNNEIRCLFSAIDEISKLEFFEKHKKIDIYNFNNKYVVAARKAFYSKNHLVLLEEAIGKVSASTVTMVPPGIPLLLPGELISSQVINSIKELYNENYITGLYGNNNQLISILKI